MRLQPFSQASYSALVRVGRGMRSMKHANLAKQDNANARARVLLDFRAQRQQKRLDLTPTNPAADRMREYRRERSLVFPLH
jgi:hypothetical protein